jgi:CheY-like chemotaxis protein
MIHVSLLEKHNIAIDLACDGGEGYEKILADPHKYDLFLLDIYMPVMTGFDLVKRLKEMNVTAPVIAVSSRYDIEQECLDAGFTEYYEKPMTAAQIREVIMRYFGNFQRNESYVDASSTSST